MADNLSGLQSGYFPVHHTKTAETPADQKQFSVFSICTEKNILIESIIFIQHAHQRDSKKLVFLDVSEMEKTGILIVRIRDAKMLSI